MPRLTFEQILERLEGVERRGDHEAMAICPTHDDQRASLHVTRTMRNGVEGVTLLHCFAHCEYADIIAAVEESDGSEPKLEVVVNGNGKRSKNKSPHWFAEQIGLPYEFLQQMGVKESDAGIVFSFLDDVTKIRPHQSTSKYVWPGHGSARKFPLWPIPDEPGKHVFICEGESDCLTLRYAGLEAYAITGGAHPQGWLSTDHYSSLFRRGVERVTIVGDADDVGQAWMHSEAKAAVSAMLETQIVDLRAYYDPFGSGLKDVNDLWRTCSNTQEFLAEFEARTTDAQGTGRIYTSAELFAKADLEIPWLIPDLIARRDKVILTGPPKTFKTWLLLELVKSLTQCKPFLGRQEWTPSEPCRVAFVEEEGSEIAFAKRVVRVLGNQPDDRVKWWIRSGINLTQRSHVDDLIEAITTGNIDVLVLDPWQRMAPGIDENSASDTGPVWDEIHRITRFCANTAVIVVHHASKGGGLGWDSIRGSSRFGGEVDLGIFVQKHQTEPQTLLLGIDGRDLPSYIEFSNSGLEVKYDLTDSGCMFELTGETMEIVLKKENKAERAVVGALDEAPKTITQLEKETGFSRSRIHGVVRELMEKNLVTRKENKYGAHEYTLGTTQD